MRLGCVCLFACSVGCGNVKSSEVVDAPTPGDATRLCDPAATFGPRVPVLGLNGTGLFLQGPRFSPDELTVYVDGHPELDGLPDVYVSSRKALTEAFEAPALLEGVNTPSIEGDVTVSVDGLTMWLISDRVSGGGVRLYVTARSSTLGDFGSPSLAAVINAADPTVIDAQPFITTDNKELWFASTRLPNMGGRDIWRASSTGAGFATPTPEPVLSSAADDFWPTLSADRLTIYISSNRSGSGFKADWDIWRSHRSTINDGFPAPTLVEELNTTGSDFATWLSEDNCRLYGFSGTTPPYEIFMATRQP